jgi:hypothetical protein
MIRIVQTPVRLGAADRALQRRRASASIRMVTFAKPVLIRHGAYLKQPA